MTARVSKSSIRSLSHPYQDFSHELKEFYLKCMTGGDLDPFYPCNPIFKGCSTPPFYRLASKCVSVGNFVISLFCFPLVPSSLIL